MTNLETIAGFLAPTVVFAILLVLHGVLPARRALGYAHPNTTQTPVRYRLNGLLVFARLSSGALRGSPPRTSIPNSPSCGLAPRRWSSSPAG